MRSHPDVSASLEESEILPSAADLAYKAMDLGFGTTGMALDDYPFACICTAEGKCDMDPAETTCKLRPGLNSAGRLSFHMLLWTSLWVLMVAEIWAPRGVRQLQMRVGQQWRSDWSDKKAVLRTAELMLFSELMLFMFWIPQALPSERHGNAGNACINRQKCCGGAIVWLRFPWKPSVWLRTCAVNQAEDGAFGRISAKDCILNVLMKVNWMNVDERRIAMYI